MGPTNELVLSQSERFYNDCKRQRNDLWPRRIQLTIPSASEIVEDRIAVVGVWSPKAAIAELEPSETLISPLAHAGTLHTVGHCCPHLENPTRLPPPGYWLHIFGG